MEKAKGYNILAVVALLIAVVGLSVGFAAFTRNLNINAAATVDPGSQPLYVVFTDSSDVDTVGTPITGTITGTDTTGATAVSGSIAANPSTATDTTNPSITGIKANFTAQGQTATYTFKVKNKSAYTAYLKSVTVGGKTCTPGTYTTASTVEAACGDINLSINIGGTDTGLSTTNTTFTSGTLAAGAADTVTLTITYATEENPKPIPDGDFSVEFGAITLNYSTLAS